MLREMAHRNEEQPRGARRMMRLEAGLETVKWRQRSQATAAGFRSRPSYTTISRSRRILVWSTCAVLPDGRSREDFQSLAPSGPGAPSEVVCEDTYVPNHQALALHRRKRTVTITKVRLS